MINGTPRRDKSSPRNYRSPNSQQPSIANIVGDEDEGISAPQMLEIQHISQDKQPSMMLRLQRQIVDMCYEDAKNKAKIRQTIMEKREIERQQCYTKFLSEAKESPINWYSSSGLNRTRKRVPQNANQKPQRQYYGMS